MGKLQTLIALALLAILAGCGSKQVVVEGRFPKPLLDPLPLSIGVVYSDDFVNHEIYDEAKGRNESDWLVRTGSAQVEFWDTLLGSMFSKFVRISDHDTLHKYEGKLDAVLVPYVDDLQYAIPLHTNVKVYEIWMKYRFRLVTLDDIHDHDNNGLSYNPENSFADWYLTAYGKTPTAFMQSDESAVNLAAIVALRDAGANFVTSFERVPGVADWLAERQLTTGDPLADTDEDDAP